MKRIFLILSISLLQIATLLGQWHADGLHSLATSKSDYKDTVWIVTGYKPLENTFKKWKFDFVLDARQTIISNTQARLLGVRVGLEYRRVHRFGLGFYNFGDGVMLNSLREVDPTIAQANLNLDYQSIFYERVLFFNKKWEWSAAVHMGRGKISGWYRYPDDELRITFPERKVRPFEISSIGYYHLTWWCSLGAGVGYRYMRSTPPEVRPIYNAPVMIGRVRIKLGKLTRSLWDKNTRYEY